MTDDLFAGLVRYLTDLARETANTLGDPVARMALMARAGLDAPQGIPPPNADVTSALTQLHQRASEPKGGGDALTLLRDLGDAMTVLVSFIEQAAGAQNQDDAWNCMATFLDLIYVGRIRANNPELLAALEALHLLSNDRLLISDLIRSRDHWGKFLLGGAHNDDGAKADNWALILGAILACAGAWIPPEDVAGKPWRQDVLLGWDTDPATTYPHIERVLQRAATYRFTHRDGAVEETAGLTVIVVPPPDGGWGLFLALELGTGLTFPIGQHLELLLKADVPDAVESFFGDPSFAEANGTGTSARILLRRKAETADAWPIGSGSGVHFEIGTFVTGIELGDPTRFKLAIGDGALILPRKALGFLGTALPSSGAKLTFDVDLVVDNKGRAAFAGGAGMTVTVPVSKSVSVLSVRTVTVGLGLDDHDQGASVSLVVLVAFDVNFSSAFRVSVDQIGGKLVWALPSSPQPAGAGTPIVHGNLGTLGDLSLEFAAPRGIGVQIDIPPVAGGGFLFFDPLHHTYGGVLEASLALGSRGIQIKAAGLLRESADEWSLVVIISAQFDPPIGDFLGLTLNAVGGMVGINVAVDVDKLRAGVHDGSMARLLFPEDPVANAPAIVSTMAAVFPPRKGGWVAGPMLQLGWGRPSSFIRLSLAIVLAFPAPAVLAILGRLRVAVPAESFSTVNIKADFLGLISFDQPSMSFDASLIESKLGEFPLTGDMVVRAGSRGFILSLGGMNPSFSSPIPLPPMRRLAVDISRNAFAKIRAEAYVAVTSNTFQLGLHAALDIDAGPASVHGWLDFDSLVQWESRFRFSVHADVGLELRVGSESIAGVYVDLLLEGPGPWHAKGSANLHILLFTVHAAFEFTWGEVDGAPSPPEVEASVQVASALSQPGAWAPVAPDGDAVVTFRDVDRDDIGVHPYGRLSVQQQVAPLGVPITRIGRSRVRGGTTTVTVTPIAGAPATTPSNGLFASSQFQDLTDDEKLARPSFESFQDGLVFGASRSVWSATQDTTASYETVFIPDGRRHFIALDTRLLRHALQTSSVDSGLHRAALFDGPDQRVELSDTTYRVVTEDTLTTAPVLPQTFGSLTAARAAAASTTVAGLLVVATHEVVA